jgi:hypothetical protein
MPPELILQRHRGNGHLIGEQSRVVSRDRAVIVPTLLLSVATQARR